MQKVNSRRGLNAWLAALLFFCLAIGGGSPVFAKEVSVESATWRFEYDNDVFFNKDNKISSGWSLQKQSAVAGSWESLEDVPGFVRRWGKAIPSLTKAGLERKQKDTNTKANKK